MAGVLGVATIDNSVNFPGGTAGVIPPVTIALWSGVLIVFLVAMFIVVIAIRRWINKDESEGPSAGFTLGDLRALHRQGQMTDEEFERAKQQMIGNAKRDAISALERPAKKSLPGSVSGLGSAAELTAYAWELKENAQREQLLREARDEQLPPASGEPGSPPSDPRSSGPPGS